MIPRLPGVALVLAAAAFSAAPRWQVQYFYDQDDSSIALRQIDFLSSQRAIAIGVKTDDRGRGEGVALLTSDGGNNWSLAELPERPVSLFCLDESACWLVGSDGGIYFSAEAGKDWKRLSRERLTTRVAFITRDHGFAVGARKKLLETRDGGKSWKKMPVLQTVKTNEDRTVFHVARFLTPKHGIIAGRTEPLRLIDTPIWMDPEPEDSVEFPTISVILQTRDAGETWEAGTTSIFGRISQIRGNMTAGFGLALVEYDRHFQHPSEIMRINFRTGGSNPILARKDFAITDVALRTDGTVFAAGFRPPGTLARTPVPGKVRVMTSSGDLKLWLDTEMDYRAVANRVSIAVAPDGAPWIATDAGMILKLVR